MLAKLEKDIKNIICKTYNTIDNNNHLNTITNKLIFELPPEKFINDFDISTNIALCIAKDLHQNPLEIAHELKNEIQKLEYIDNIIVEKPAFLNIKLKDNILWQMAEDVSRNGDRKIIKNLGNGERVNVEFCSANPTGPLHIGHARGTIFGDVLASLLQRSGYDVCREYYVNDAGGQMEKLEKSIQWRIDGCKEELPDGCYAGDYLQAIADKRKKVLLKQPDKKWSKIETAKEIIETLILPTIQRLKVKYDVFTSEQTLKDNNAIENGIQHLTDLGFIYKGILQPPKGKQIEDYEPREQLLFKSSQFGDDTDRPLVKSDGSHTYFASDIAYHYDKWKRGFNNMVVVLGADHKGYVKRLTSAVKAISNNEGEVHIKLCELVNFMKNGQMVKMSKRKNNFLTIDDVLDEIDPNILRFIILTRKADTVLNFDLEKAKEQSKDNPIWYIQYAHSRCCSALENANKQGYNIDANTNIIDNNYVLPNEFHRLLVKASFYTRFIELAVKNYEPYFFANYIIQLATEFHSLWSLGIGNDKLKFIQEDEHITIANLQIVKCIKNLLHDALEIFGIEALMRM